jgi:hypothetical protein
MLNIIINSPDINNITIKKIFLKNIIVLNILFKVLFISFFINLNETHTPFSLAVNKIIFCLITFLLINNFSLFCLFKQIINIFFIILDVFFLNFSLYFFKNRRFLI